MVHVPVPAGCTFARAVRRGRRALSLLEVGGASPRGGQFSPCRGARGRGGQSQVQNCERSAQGRGARRGRALAKARRSPVRSTTSSAPLSTSRAHRVRHRRRNTDGGTPAAVASLAGNAATQTPGRAQRSRAGGRAWTALELRSGRARAASGLRLELLEEELARRARSDEVETRACCAWAAALMR